MNLDLRPGAASDRPAIMAIAASWPTHFVDEGLRQIERDFKTHKATVATVQGRVVGFLIWSTNGEKMELLWLAVDPRSGRRRIGTSLVSSVLAEARTEDEVFLKTATTDSVVPGTLFEGSAYSATNEFFKTLGFDETARIERYWGPQNHALVMTKRLRDIPGGHMRRRD